jgi:hypothetical protein
MKRQRKGLTRLRAARPVPNLPFGIAGIRACALKQTLQLERRCFFDFSNAVGARRIHIGFGQRGRPCGDISVWPGRDCDGVIQLMFTLIPPHLKLRRDGVLNAKNDLCNCSWVCGAGCSYHSVYRSLGRADPAVCDAFLKYGKSPLRLQCMGPLLGAPGLRPPLSDTSVSIRR